MPKKNSNLTLLLLLLLFLPITAFSININQPVPNFQLEDISQSQTLSLKQFKGKIVILDFWASWCDPCKEAMPQLIKLQKKYKSQGLQLIGINVDEDIKLAIQFLKKMSANFPSVHDKEQKYLEKLNVQVMPTTFVIDHNLKLKKTFQGYRSNTKKEIEKHIRHLISLKPSK